MAKLIEFVLPTAMPDFDFDVQEDKVMHGDHARTYPDSNLIVISASTYDGAVSGVGRDNFTLAHEFGHLLLHRGIEPSFARLRAANEPVFVDSEWQADTFAAEFLMPYSELAGRPNSLTSVCKTYKVSTSAAALRLRKINAPVVL
ncbi:ImmA/IrrE family metallo-endopeptidase [Spongiibacter sp. UBA1325]|uniref:ImmA/IrrE family metallo-endopeptidase n=1 Tax=Spongiibacter sp. UBA1325 TaxID=1947543 RepID=UPI00257FFF2B|nr:ImmA/IrrE family metallo-endopeptidase [Spongiibacter sp. UBA1325]|tara:strand:+ start:1597 stop:2031 length:435 start_codon:yes stop_codon:yes gene_type:complete